MRRCARPAPATKRLPISANPSCSRAVSPFAAAPTRFSAASSRCARWVCRGRAAMPSLKDSDRHIVDSMGGLLDDAGGLKRVRKLHATPLSFDRGLWSRLATQGWLGAAVPETQGGTGLALGEIALLLEYAGKRLLPEPLVQALGGTQLLARCGAGAADLLASAIAGNTLAVPAE